MAIRVASKRNIVGATFLITGTCIGGGILGLPVETGMAGFFPSIFVMMFGWVFMTLSGLYYAEANLWLPEGAHVMTMASKLLGPIGKYSALILFLFIDYSSLVAYIAGGGKIMGHFVEWLFDVRIHRYLELTLFAGFFGSFLYMGTSMVDRVNTLLVAGLAITYFALIGLGVSEVQPHLLLNHQWRLAPYAFPLVLTTFSFQMIVPSLTPYLNRDPRAIRNVILYGTSIAFFIYLIWQIITLGILPMENLMDAFQDGLPATEPLRAVLESKILSRFASAFAFFAIVTSFLGIGLSLYDFLSDSLRIPRKSSGKLILLFFVIAPSLFFAMLYPRAFLFALEIGGGYGDTLLNGIIPIAMIWVGRYVRKYKSALHTWGDKRLLVFLGLLSVLVIVYQTLNLVHY